MSETSLQFAAVPEARDKEPSPIWGVLTAIFSSWQGISGGILFGLILFGAVFSPWLTPYDYTALDLISIMQGPNGAHFFGTDELGRDILSRVLEGARVSLYVAAASVVFSLVIGSAIGLVAGWIGGVFEKTVMRLMDAMLAFPLIVMALAIVAVLGPSMENAIIAIGITKIPHFARLMRGEVLVLKELDYVRAARVLGAGNTRILLRHILPNSVGPVLVYSSIAASQAIMTEASLSFLGLGVQPPTPSWGGMVSIGMQNFQFWWMSFYPGLAIFLAVLSFNLLGDAVRDALDARLQ